MDGKFSIVGANKGGTFEKKIAVPVNGNQNTNIHTCCSQPIDQAWSVVTSKSLRALAAMAVICHHCNQAMVCRGLMSPAYQLL